MVSGGEGGPTRVVYVMGAGRSGSTILGVVLGNCPGVFYAGELDAWLRRRGVPNFGGAERERFWAEVLARMRVEESMFGTAARESLEHSAAVLRPDRRRGRRRLGPDYRRVSVELFAELAAASGATHVVDTSHFPLRAAELQRAEGIELYLLYLVRAPGDVVASFARRDVDQPSKSTLGANAYLLLTHLLARDVFRRQPRERRLLVEYDAFVADPAATVRRVLDLVGVECEMPDLGALRTGVAFQGNRLLGEEEIALRQGAPAPRAADPLTAVLQAPVSAAVARLGPAVRSSVAA